jgi:N-acetylglucosamine-6-sulfatase
VQTLRAGWVGSKDASTASGNGGEIVRWGYKRLVLFAMVSMFVGLGMTASHPESSLAKTASKPNIIFILTDDMRKDDLNARYMPKTSSLLADQGMSFENAFVSTPVCCPSRATIMRGQYAHNTGVWFNTNHFNPDPAVPDGGWEGYNGNGYEEDNVATRLHDETVGYRTGLFGKYLNGYDGRTVPPGWDDWFATSGRQYFDYDVNDNGTIVHYGSEESDYSTDVLSEQTQQFIGESVALGKPFFAYVAPKAPHGPSTPAPRDLQTFDGEQAPRLPSFDEEDVSDKPPWIQSLRRLRSNNIANIDQHHEDRVESLQAVDDLVEGVVDKLQSYPGVLDNTYIVFTSDNGFYHGEHRIRDGKGRPYEEAPQVPLVIRGPGVRTASTEKLVLNTDYFPTFMDWAKAQTPDYVDGRSLRPVLKGRASIWRLRPVLKGGATIWRTAILIEGRKRSDDPEIPVDRNYNGIRTSTSKYVEYEGGFRELYDLTPGADPYELSNIYYSAEPTVPPRPDLKARLDALKSCAGAADASATSCKRAEGG